MELDKKKIEAELKEQIIDHGGNVYNKLIFDGLETIDEHIEYLDYLTEYFKVAKELGFTCWSAQGWRYWEHPNYEPKEVE